MCVYVFMCVCVNIHACVCIHVCVGRAAHGEKVNKIKKNSSRTSSASMPPAATMLLELANINVD
jgi:hypothetical protein